MPKPKLAPNMGKAKLSITLNREVLYDVLNRTQKGRPVSERLEHALKQFLKLTEPKKG